MIRDEWVTIRQATEEAGRDLAWLFDGYLRQADLPALVEERTDDTLNLRWQVPGDQEFPLPVPERVDGEERLVEMDGGSGSLRVPPNAPVLIDPEMRVLRRLPIIGTCEEIEAERAARRR